MTYYWLHASRSPITPALYFRFNLEGRYFHDVVSNVIHFVMKKKIREFRWTKSLSQNLSRESQFSCFTDVKTKISPWIRNPLIRILKGRLMISASIPEADWRVTSHPRIAHGQRYPMPRWERSSEVVEWEQGSSSKGPMSCGTRVNFQMSWEGKHQA